MPNFLVLQLTPVTITTDPGVMANCLRTDVYLFYAFNFDLF